MVQSFNRLSSSVSMVMGVSGGGSPGRKGTERGRSNKADRGAARGTGQRPEKGPSHSKGKQKRQGKARNTGEVSGSN